MNFEDAYVSREDGYSIGTESTTGRHYASVPVSNGIVDYEEYYEITSEQFRVFLSGRDAAIEFVESCRRHERDDLLIERPGANRGTPV
jgi:hypothetical protein